MWKPENSDHSYANKLKPALETAMEQVIAIRDRGQMPDRPANFRICTHDDSGREIKVIITPQAQSDLKQYCPDLDTIARRAVEWALSQGKRECKICLSTEPSADCPDYHAFKKWLLSQVCE